jgi:biotin carboxyl carrier protein
MAAGRFVVTEGGRTHAVEVDAGGNMSIDGAEVTCQVSPLGRAEYAVVAGPRRSRVFAAGPPERREVFIDGRVFTFDVGGAGHRQPRAASAHGEALSAPMPATVLKVLVVAGQTVRRGETLLTLEAMKMELPVRAPLDGTIQAVHCREGELVQAGVRLLDLS